MNCKTCDYSLWNLRTRVCPECGSPFSIADFEMRAGSVRFCCPHCQQSYFGTDEKGLLVPREFECITCGQFITMEEMVILPAEGMREQDTVPRSVPWAIRRDIGFVSAWFRTIGWGFVMGKQVGGSLPGVAAPWPAVVFAVLTICIVVIASQVPMLCFLIPIAIGGGGGGAGGGAGGGVVMAGPGMLFVMQALGSLGALLVMLVVTIPIAHGVLKVCGGASQSIGATTEAICYSCGPLVLTAVPCFTTCLSPFAVLWWMITAGLALCARHKAKAWQASVAMVLAGAPAIVLGTVSGWMVMFYSMTGTVGTGAFGGAAFMGQISTQVKVSSLTMAWRSQTAGAPANAIHAASLMESGFINADAFLTDGATLILEDVPVGSLTLADFQNIAGRSLSESQQAAIDEANAALPADVIAHRLGDFVFAYHGVDQTTASQELWVVIAAPLPDPALTASPSAMIVVGKVGSGTEAIPMSNFAASLQAQNALRARFNLPPLPMPETITHEQPAVAGDQ